MPDRVGENHFALWLRAWLDEHKDAGWSQTRLAHALGVSQPLVASWVRRAQPSRPEISTLMRLAPVLDVDLAELLQAAGYEPAPDLTPHVDRDYTEAQRLADEIAQLPPTRQNILRAMMASWRHEPHEHAARLQPRTGRVPAY